MVKNIIVGKNNKFSGSRWREAILYFCFCTWENHKDIRDNPFISFDGVHLRWCWEGCERYNQRFIGYGKLNESVDVPKVMVDRKIQAEWLNVGKVRDSLMCFVKDDHCRIITINLEAHGASVPNPCLILIKEEQSGHLHVTGNVVSTEEAMIQIERMKSREKRCAKVCIRRQCSRLKRYGTPPVNTTNYLCLEADAFSLETLAEFENLNIPFDCPFARDHRQQNTES